MKHWFKVFALAAIFASPLVQATTPTIAERATSKVTSNGTSHAVTLPVTGIASGDLLIAAISWDCTSGTATLTGWPAGWTLIDEQKHSTGSYATSIYYKIADGTETSPMTLTTSSSDQSVHRVWRISAGTFNAAIAPGFASNLLQSNLAPDPPSLTPAGGSKTYLWLALASVNEGNSTGTATVTGFPASYTDTGTDLSSVSNGAVALGWAEFASTAASENPGAFALFGAVAENNDSYTVFVAPSGPATFTAGPTLGTPTATTLPTTFTTDQSGNVEAVACPDGQTPPTQVQTFAHNCTGDIAAAAFFTEAVTAGVADGHTFTGLTHSTVYDLYFGIDAAVDSSAVSTIANATTSCGGTPSVTSVSSDDVLTATETNFSVVGTGFCITKGSGSFVFQNVTPTAKTITCSSWSNTLLSGCDVSGVGMGVVNGLAYGSLTAKVTNSSGTSGTKAITVNVPSGTTATTLTSVLTLDFDVYGNPFRLFGDPLDLQATSQVGKRNAVGCLVSEITINVDASLSIDSDCTAFDWDFTRDLLYVGTVATIGVAGAPPVMGADDIEDHVLAVGLAMESYDLDSYFTLGDAAASARAMRQTGSATTTGVHVTPGFSLETIWDIEDSSPLLSFFGSWIRCGANGTPVQLLWANPLTNQAKVKSPRTCGSNATVFTLDNNAASISQISVNSGTGVVSGTPDTDATTTLLLYRLTDASGLFAEVREPFQIDVVTIPDVTASSKTAATATLEALGIDVSTSAVQTQVEAVDEVLTQTPSSSLWGTDVLLTIVGSPGTIVGGWAVTSTGVVLTIPLDDVTAVPGTASIVNGFAVSPTGAVYIARWPSSNSVSFNRGTAIRSDGAMIVVEATPNLILNGKGHSTRGELCVTTDAPELIINGVGILNNGTVSVSNL